MDNVWPIYLQFRAVLIRAIATCVFVLLNDLRKLQVSAAIA